ncbi:10812_t:CDS:2, partial [Diversispora eburnea]
MSETSKNKKIIIHEKKKGLVWKHWTVLVDENDESNKPHPHVKCNYCSKIFNCEIATQIQVHLDKNYKGAPDNAKSKKRTNPFFNNEQSNEQLNEISIRKLATEFLDKVFEEVKEESDKEILLAQNLCM